MQKMFRFGLVLIFSAFIFSANVFAQGDNGKIRELYNRMSQNQKTTKSMISGVRMENYNSQLKETETKDGEVKYLPAGKQSANIRLDWRAPQQEILSVVDGNYILYRPRLNTVYRGKTKEAQKSQNVGNSLSFIGMSGAELKQNFDAKWISDGEQLADGTNAYKMKLTPKTAANYNYAEIWVTEDGMPVQVKIYEKNGDTTNVLLYNMRKNAKVGKNDLKVSVPKNAQEIKG